jgi:hypothetical protein
MCVGGLGGALGLLGRVAEGEDDWVFVEAVKEKKLCYNLMFLFR